MTGSLPVTVARIRAEEWSALKTVRLAALQDAPYAFGGRLEDVILRPDSEWQQVAADRAISPKDCTYFARDDSGRVIGMAGSFRDAEIPDACHLVAVWVAPESRGSDAAPLLIRAIAEWARSIGALDLYAYVTDGNDRAARFYEKCGFTLQPPGAPRPGEHGSVCDILYVQNLISRGDP